VTNCGDAPWSFTDVSTHAATAPAYHPVTACSTGQTMPPGAACAVDVTFAPLTPGQMSGGVWLRNTTTTPDQIVTFYGRGVDAQAGSTSLQFVPAALDFGNQLVGTTSPVQTLLLRNVGPAPLTPHAIVLNGPTPYDFRFPGTCLRDVAIPPGGSCELYFTFTPAQTGTRAAQLNVDAPELANLAIMSIRGVGVVTSSASTVDVIEFYNAPLDHYFLTAVPEEAAVLDHGVLGPDWHRTGLGFRAYAVGANATAASDVCRFFGTPGVGPSAHFFTADASECMTVKANPHWLFEGLAFRALLPVEGACPAGTDTVVRFFWQGTEVLQSRHRYVRDAATLAQMRGLGWVEEGPVFCSPQ